MQKDRSEMTALKKGAVFQMEEKAYALKAGDTMILPAMKKHTLHIKTDLKAVIAMELEGEIQFE